MKVAHGTMDKNEIKIIVKEASKKELVSQLVQWGEGAVTKKELNNLPKSRINRIATEATIHFFETKGWKVR